MKGRCDPPEREEARKPRLFSCGKALYESAVTLQTESLGSEVRISTEEERLLAQEAAGRLRNIRARFRIIAEEPLPESFCEYELSAEKTLISAAMIELLDFLLRYGE